MQKKMNLIHGEIQKTIKTLQLRIQDRFPSSGLARVCQTLGDISQETNNTVQWIERANYPLRICIYSLMAFSCMAVFRSVIPLNIKVSKITIIDLVQITVSALDGLVLIGAGVIFLVTYENRRKRKRVIGAINQLKGLAHIIDMHQLTKDPDSVSRINIPTPHSPSRSFNKYELGRYLNYCTEMLALISKTGFLYVQDFHDPIATNAVDELEDLTTGLSRKIWQKIMIIQSKDNG